MTKYQNRTIESIVSFDMKLATFVHLKLHFTFQFLVLSPISSLLRWVCYFVYMLNKCSLWCCTCDYLCAYLSWNKSACQFLAVFVWASALESLFNELLALCQNKDQACSLQFPVLIMQIYFLYKPTISTGLCVSANFKWYEEQIAWDINQWT
jgi:hypothetical protein